MQEGKVPSLEEFHSRLIEVLGVTQNEKAEYPIQISKQLLQKYEQIGEFPVAKEILSSERCFTIASHFLRFFKQILVFV